jgi:hypothetical protein
MGSIIYKIRKTNKRLKSLSRIPFIIILTSVLYLVAFFLNYVIGFIKEKDFVLMGFSSGEKSIVIYIFSSMILAPVVETFLGQSFPYYLLNKIKYFNERSYLILLTSALFFGLLHFYSLFYIFYAFVLGLIFMYAYMIRIKTDRKTFYLIAISHFLLNLGILIKNFF